MKTKSIKTPDNWKKLKPHALAQLLEFGSNIDLDGLTKHIKEHGYDQDEPIILFEGMILDGRHRHECCKRAGIIPPFREFCGKDPVAYIRKKIFRQHLPVSERAKIAATLADLPAHRPELSAPNDALNNGLKMSQTQAAKALGVSRRSVQRAKSRTSSKNRTSKSGEVKFSYKDYITDLGKLYRWIDKFGNAYDCKESSMARELRDLCKVFKHKFDGWVQFNTKEAVPAYGDPCI